MDTDPTPRKHRGSLADTMSASVYTELPEPPYTYLIKDLVWMSFAIDPSAMQPFLPPGLRMVTPALAQMGVCHIGSGWGLKDYSTVIPCVVIEDFPSPDTSEAGFLPTGLANAAGYQLIRRHYADYELGHSETRVDREGVSFAAWRDGRLLLEGRANFDGEAVTDAASIDRYLGINESGVLVSFMTTISGSARAMRIDHLTIAADAPPVWQAFRPQTLHWAMHLPEMLTNRSVPQPVVPGLGAEAAGLRQVLLDTLDRRGRACAILGPEGAVLQANAGGRRMLALAGQARGPLRLADAAAQGRLARALAGAGEATFLLPRPDGGAALVLQLARIDAALAGPGAVLALLIDPAEARPDSGAEVLQLLGLTPAEARVAAAVGAGLPPREAALRLHLTEGTVRSTLKVVFDKLALSRQVDLVQLVARLSG